jgi:hypothetical protein
VLHPLVYIAIHLIHPRMPSSLVDSYTNAISTEADKVDIDPLTIVTIIEHETGSTWNPRAISPDGEDYGFMQVRARHYGGKPEWLLNPSTNIMVGAYLIKASKDFCRKTLHREPEYQEWLSCYQGSCTNPAHFCKPTKLTKVFEDYQVCLEKDLLNEKPWTDCRFH